MAQMRFASSRSSNTKPKPQQPTPAERNRSMQLRFNANRTPQGQPTNLTAAQRAYADRAGQQRQPVPPTPPAAGSWAQAYQQAQNAAAQLIRMGGAAAANAWNNRFTNAQGSGVTPEMQQQAQYTYGNMRPPANYSPNPLNPYAAPGFIQSGPAPSLQTYQPPARYGPPAPATGPGSSGWNMAPTMEQNAAQRRATFERNQYNAWRGWQATAARMTGQAADYLSRPTAPIADQGGGGYGGGGWGDWGGYGGGGGGGSYDPVKEFYNAMANWNIARPQGG